LAPAIVLRRLCAADGDDDVIDVDACPRSGVVESAEVCLPCALVLVVDLEPQWQARDLECAEPIVADVHGEQLDRCPDGVGTTSCGAVAQCRYPEVQQLYVIDNDGQSTGKNEKHVGTHLTANGM
jgi:hypothetical protein